MLAEKPVRENDIVKTDILPNFRYIVTTPNDSIQKRMWTISENSEIQSGEGLENGFGIHTTDAAGLFYHRGKETGDMQLDLLFRPDKTAGQVFSVPGSPADDGPNNLRADLYIKYDPQTRTGHSLRFWRTTLSERECLFQFYRITDGKGTPLGDLQVLTGVFKRDTHLTMKVEGNKLSVSAYNTKEDQVLFLASDIDTNPYGGAGMS